MIKILLCLFLCVGPYSYGNSVKQKYMKESIHRYEVNYTYPTRAEKSSLAHWKLKNTKWIEKNGYIKLTYELPPLLVGDSNIKISLEGKERKGFFYLKGKKGTAVCLIHDDQNRVWMIKMKKIKVNFKKLSKLIRKMNNRKDRKEIAKLFSSDPIGIISVRKI